MGRTGPSGALVRRMARSKDGSNSTAVALYELPFTTTTVSGSPATTWALVATMPGPTTKADPSCSLPHAVPRTLTIEVMAGLASACVWALVGVATELAVGGIRVEKTCGKPWVLRKFCRSP